MGDQLHENERERVMAEPVLDAAHARQRASGLVQTRIAVQRAESAPMAPQLHSGKRP